MKRFILIILVLILVLGSSNFVLAQEKIEINFFYAKTCPFCAQEKIFLEELVQKYPEIELKELGTFEEKNLELLKKLYKEYQVPAEAQGLVPVTFIKGRYFLGYGGDEQTGKEIENHILAIIKETELPEDGPFSHIDLDRRIRIPILGEISLSGLSPLSLAAILGALDGFNACAMVALGFLLSILISTGIRERVFLIGGTFILVSGIVYFLFISAWLNLFLVLERIQYITLFVGIFIIFFSLFLLKDYFHGVICKLCKINPKGDNFFVRTEKKLFKKMEDIARAELPLHWLLLGVAGVAAGVNLIELVCSFGFPLAFTKILANFQVPTFSYYLYLLVYIFFYMLDDFFIFSFAVWTLKITQVSQKYLKAIKFVSGVLLLLLGLIMLIRPDVLMF